MQRTVSASILSKVARSEAPSMSSYRNDHFTSKLETGPEHWAEPKPQWIDETPLLKELLADGGNDPQHAHKLKALEVLCRDVMKRLRDAQETRCNPHLPPMKHLTN
jgi:hypothetical protein